MAKLTLTFGINDLPMGPFGDDPVKAAEWLDEAQRALVDTMATQCSEIMHGYIDQECAFGDLIDEPEEGTEDFWDQFSEPEPVAADLDLETLEAANGGYWGEHPEHLVEDWQHEIANGDSRLGYWEWVEAKILA